MMLKPDYYDKFQCIADRCKHSCCVGWEIDIDEETLEIYKNTSGELGKRLCDSIEDGHFRLSEDERCPFLNDKNLCDIIIDMGKEGLCQICSDHPRFVNFTEYGEEVGVGMCCEAAARLIVTKEDKTRIIGEGNNNFALRDKLFDILQNREKNIDERILDVFFEFDISIRKLHWQKIFMGLERLDKSWTKRLLSLNGERRLFEKSWDIPFEQILIYFIYRHLSEGVYDGRMEKRIKFAILSFYIIREIFAHSEESMEELVEICRMYSAEIEYSEENTERLLDLL